MLSRLSAQISKHNPQTISNFCDEHGNVINLIIQTTGIRHMLTKRTECQVWKLSNYFFTC
jgi:hypothetical protein